MRGCDMRKLLLWFVVVAAIVCRPGGVWACDIPLYRFALDMWEPAKYEIVIFHRGPLSAEAAGAAEWLKKRARDGAAPANCYVRLVDLAEEADEDESVMKLWRAQVDPVLPWAVLRYPEDSAGDKPRIVWAGPLAMPSAEAIVRSPVRAKIVRRIDSGQTIVWILLESGDAAKDQAAAKLLEAQLAKLQAQMNEGISDTQPASAPAGQLEAWPEPFSEPVEFSLLRLGRSDPRETVLVNMLLDGWPGLRAQAATEPAAFPVFGRGKLPGALVGPGISAESIAEACWLITGPCSCGMGTGFGLDLLLDPQWQPFEAEGATLAGAAGAVGAGGGHLLRNVVVAAGCIFVAGALLAAVILREGRRGKMRS